MYLSINLMFTLKVFKSLKYLPKGPFYALYKRVYYIYLDYKFLLKLYYFFQHFVIFLMGNLHIISQGFYIVICDQV